MCECVWFTDERRSVEQQQIIVGTYTSDQRITSVEYKCEESFSRLADLSLPVARFIVRLG